MAEIHHLFESIVFCNIVLQGNSALLILNWSRSQKVVVLLTTSSLGCAANSTTVLDRKTNFDSHEYSLQAVTFPPSSKKGCHPYSMSIVLVSACVIGGYSKTLERNKQIAAEWWNYLKRNGRSIKPGLTHSWIFLILLFSGKNVVQ